MKKRLSLFALLTLCLFFVFSCSKNEPQPLNKSVLGSSTTVEDIVYNALRTIPSLTIHENILSFRNGDGCITNPAGPSEVCYSTVVAVTINLPASGSRPACNDMKLNYVLTICFDQFTFEITRFQYSNFSAFPGSGCPDFITWYNNLPDIEKGAAQDKWEFDASFIVEQLNILAFSDYIKPCPLSANSQSLSEFTTELCFNRCLIITGGTFPGFKIVKNFCGTQCCIRTRQFCKNQSGTVIFYNPEYQTIGQPCTSSPAFCPNGIPLNLSCGILCGPR